MTPNTTDTGTVRLAFVCVQNAGRSQMATAFAERERASRGLTDRIEIRTGGTDPADSIHDEVLAAMEEVGVDLSERDPTGITQEELNRCDYVATMGCSTLDIGGVAEDVMVRDWNLPDPAGADHDAVCAIRDDIAQRVRALFDEAASER
jgi:protein-tyrosine-phosphatase